VVQPDHSIPSSPHTTFYTSAFVASHSDHDNGDIFADSGASHHYVTDKAYFQTYTLIEPWLGKSTKRGVNFTIVGIGTVCVALLVNGKRSEITLKNVMHAPDLAANLVLIPTINEAGGGMWIAGGVIHIMHLETNRVVMEGHVTSLRLYKLNVENILGAPHIVLITDARTDLAMWHRRFGHLNEETIRRMASMGVVREMRITREKATGKCEDCIYRKQTRPPFTKSIKEDRPLDRIYVDLMGLFNIHTLRGYSYAMTIDNGGSSYRSVHMLKSKRKKETELCIRAYIAMAERQTGHHLKAVRMDGGTKFCNNMWTAFFTETGIIHETTSPYTPQQNGVSERGHRTLLDFVRSMLKDSGLPRYLYGEAMQYKAYMGN
jgi:hypothetical protein